MFAIPFVLASMVAIEEQWHIPGPEGITLADAREFGISPACIEGLWMQAQKHRELMWQQMAADNPLPLVEYWEQECAWRAEAYNQADNVLRCSLSLQHKLRCLAKLKKDIGDEAYESRRMPNPTPSYRNIHWAGSPTGR